MLPLAQIEPGGVPAMSRDAWAATAVHAVSTYFCAHCGTEYQHPDQVYACVDIHAAAVRAVDVRRVAA